ncbi:MAG: serine/threonine-protein kinase [Polyangiales bacterium]
MKTPVKFGKYYLLERISVGGMAEVFKAKAFGEAGFERLVAVKRILPSIAEDQEFIAMFVDEAKLAVQLTHPNIAQIFELGKVGDSYFIALEYVAGKDMRAIFERAKKRTEAIPVPMACFMVMKLCEGLDYAHNKKDSAGRSLELVHRDVSPQNILVSYDGDVKLIDFGIAKAASKSSKTQAGILKGKFGYMSPEQVRGLQVDRRSDVFAVGICLYELLTTERLFVGESDFSTLEKVRNVEITPPTFYNKKIPEELENIVLKALAKHPEDRYRSSMDLHDDLQSFMYTSGNFFARKDLASYMGRLFDEEIRKEQTRDEEFRKFDSRKAAEAEVFESAAPAPGPAVSGPPRGPVPPALPGRSAAPSAPAGPAVRPARALALRGVTFSRPPRGRRVHPRAAAASGWSSGRSAAVAVARQPTGAMPVHAAVAASAPAIAPHHVDELDWSDDESATQIMDKPADVIAALQSSPRPAARGPSAPAPAPAAPLPRPQRLTGQIPALPALPGRQPSTTALGVAPPATSLPPASSPASAPVVSAPPMAAPMVSAPPVAAPVVNAPHVAAPVVNARAVSSAPPPPASPSGRPADAFNNLAPGFAPPPAATVKPPHKHDWPANPPAAQPAAQRPARDTRSTALLAFFGVIAVAALVVLGLQLKGPPPQATLTINTTDGAEVTVDDRPVPGVGGRYEVGGLDPQRQHTIEIRKSGFETVTQSQDVAVGPNTVRFVLREMPAPSIAVPPPVEQPIAAPPTSPSVAALVPAPAAPAPGVVQPPPTQQMLPPPPAPPAPVVAAAPTARPRVRDAVPRQPRQPAIRPTIPTAPAPVAAPAPSGGGGTGTLLLSTTPASSCSVNGMTHSTPWRVALPPGRYAVRCVNTDLASSATYNVTITAGQTADYRNRPLE